MKDQIRSYVGASMEALNPAAARDLARSILQGASRDRVQSLAQDLMGWSMRSRERATQLIQREVARQLKAVGVATKDDLDALRKRVRDLEKAATSTTGSPAKKPTAKKATAAKRSTPKRSTAKRSTAKRSTAPKPTGSSSSSSGEGGS